VNTLTNKFKALAATAIVLFAALALIASPVAAAPFTVTDTTTGFIVDYSIDIVGAPDSDYPGEELTLTGSIEFELRSFSHMDGNTYLDFLMTVSHTTDISAYPDANVFLSAFGFFTDPQLISAELIDPEGDHFVGLSIHSDPGNATNLAGVVVDLCAYTGQNCMGADGQGMQPGVSDTFGLLLGFEGEHDSIDFDEFRVRHAGDFGSFTHTIGNGNGNGNGNGQEVSEPAILFLLGAGLLAMGWMRRRQTLQS
jgi:hypothetical protein